MVPLSLLSLANKLAAKRASIPNCIRPSAKLADKWAKRPGSWAWPLSGPFFQFDLALVQCGRRRLGL